MRKLNQELVKDLLFEDSLVEKMEFYREQRLLKIFIDSAYLDRDEDYLLGKGVLYFSAWDSILIKQFDSVDINNYTLLEGLPEGILKEIYEFSLSDEKVCLAGNGLKCWVEWVIVKPKMYAEFEEYREEDYL